jgi:hypothetical protein
MKIVPFASLFVLAGALPSPADYVVDIDLGILPIGDTLVEGTTAAVVLDPGPPPVTIGGNNNSIFFQELALTPTLNYGNELVFQFTLAAPSLLTITKEVDFINDPDFFLLGGLTTSIDPDTGKLSADNALGFAFLDLAPPETTTLGTLREGTYYLTVENFDGFDGSTTPGNSDFTATLNVLEAFPTELAIDLGAIGVEGAPLAFDTFGSNFNTELAIYDLFGDVVLGDDGELLVNDDAGGSQQSEILIPGGLPAGNYYAILAGNGVTFLPGPSVTTGGAVGDFVFNYSLGPNLAPDLEIGTTSVGTETQESQFFLFSIVRLPDTTSLGTIANAGDPFEINFFGTGFDTEMGVFDSFGFLQFENDDAGGVQSAVDFPAGLAAGTWYVALLGYNGLFGDGFNTTAGAAGGGFVLNHPLGVEDGILNSGETLWFSFEIGAPPMASGINITSIEFNADTNEFTLAWESNAPGPFNILMGSEVELVALTAAPNNLLPTTIAVGVTSPVTIGVPPVADKVFLQVRASP